VVSRSMYIEHSPQHPRVTHESPIENRGSSIGHFLEVRLGGGFLALAQHIDHLAG